MLIVEDEGTASLTSCTRRCSSRSGRRRARRRGTPRASGSGSRWCDASPSCTVAARGSRIARAAVRRSTCSCPGGCASVAGRATVGDARGVRVRARRSRVHRRSVSRVHRRCVAGTPIWYHEPTDHWLVSRFADVNALLRDRRFGRTYHHVATHAEMGRPEEPDWHGPFWHLIRSGILDMEPPDHTRVRALVSKAFTPRMVEGMRDPIQRHDGRVGRRGRRCRGVRPDRDARRAAARRGHRRAARGAGRRPHLLRPWSADICGMYELRPSEETARTAVRASVEFSEYLRTLSRRTARRRRRTT